MSVDGTRVFETVSGSHRKVYGARVGLGLWYQCITYLTPREQIGANEAITSYVVGAASLMWELAEVFDITMAV